MSSCTTEKVFVLSEGFFILSSKTDRLTLGRDVIRWAGIDLLVSNDNNNINTVVVTTRAVVLSS